MAMSEIKKAIYRLLQNGPVDAVDGSLPVAGFSKEEVDTALAEMYDAEQISAHGNSSGFTHYGVDPDAFSLCQHRHLYVP